jgi:chromo domain-containing protein 1
MTNYVEQDLHKEPLSMIQDKYPILSERREIAEEHPVDYFNTLERSQDEANLHMLRYYSAVQTDMRRDYRHFYVVHSDPSAPCVQQWKQELQTIAEVMTPEQCVSELSRPWKESKFNFLDFAMPW